MAVLVVQSCSLLSLEPGNWARVCHRTSNLFPPTLRNTVLSASRSPSCRLPWLLRAGLGPVPPIRWFLGHTGQWQWWYWCQGGQIIKHLPTTAYWRVTAITLPRASRAMAASCPAPAPTPGWSVFSSKHSPSYIFYCFRWWQMAWQSHHCCHVWTNWKYFWGKYLWYCWSCAGLGTRACPRWVRRGRPGPWS